LPHRAGNALDGKNSRQRSFPFDLTDAGKPGGCIRHGRH
jgi:hypothetical protein